MYLPLPVRLLQGLVLLAVLLRAANGATLRVGPDEALKTIADAARTARDGDVVEIMAGEYRGDVAIWHQKRLSIRGVGQRPVLVAQGRHAEGKAIWVIRNGEFVVQNIEFRGTRVPDLNGAGIRLERGKLTVRDCAFIDNQMGILAANAGDAELAIENSFFADAPQQTRSLPHLLYAGRIARLSVTGSRFAGGYWGHLIKSRARQTDLRYNLIYDGPSGQSSYEVDLPNGGQAVLIGNIIGQSRTTQNPVVVSFGAEGDLWPESTLYMVHNTLVSDRTTGAWFLRVPLEKFPQVPTVVGINNLTVGAGIFSLGAAGDFRGNFPVTQAILSDVANLDFSLAHDSMLRGLVEPADADSGTPWKSLAPTAEFAFPVGTRPLANPARWTPGAVQTPGQVVR